MVAPKPGCTDSTWATEKTLQRNAALPPPVYLSEFALAFHYRGHFAFSPRGLSEIALLNLGGTILNVLTVFVRYRAFCCNCRGSSLLL